MGKLSLYLVFVANILALGLAGSAQAEIAVIVNKSSTLAAASKEDIAKIFIGEAKDLGGASVQPADQGKASDIREQFYQKSSGMSARQAMAAWTKIVFSGHGKAPKELSSDAEVKSFVTSTDGGIGYVDAKSLDGSVKALLTLP